MQIDLEKTEVDMMIEALEDYQWGCLFQKTKDEIRDLIEKFKRLRDGDR